MSTQFPNGLGSATIAARIPEMISATVVPVAVYSLSSRRRENISPVRGLRGVKSTISGRAARAEKPATL
jgi:hypothetical protein